MTRVVGVDGTDPSAWVIVELEEDHLVSIQQLATLEDALAEAEEAEIVAVNLAVGHDDRHGEHRGGRRRCDLAARERWGEARPDLPLVPPPALLEHDSLEAAQAEAEDRGWVAPVAGLWRLKDHLLALDRACRDARLFEVRTEASFQLLHDRHGGEGRLPTPPHAWKGMYARLKLLADEGLRPARSTGGVGHLSPKDAIGATVAGWTARRIADGIADTLPEDPPTDPRTQRPVAIWS